MNRLNEILSTTFTDALGWTLFHSLWQGAIIAFALYILLLIFRRSQPNIRYFITVCALFSTLTVAIITFIYQLNIAGSATFDKNMPLNFLKAIPSAADDLAVNNSSGFTPDRFFAAIQSQIPLLLLGWLAGVLIAACKLAGGYYYMKTKIRKALSHCPAELKQLLPRLTGQLNLNRLVNICEVSFLKVPAVFGHIKPVILIPIGLVNHLTPQQVEMVILHELAHIKRNDFLINLLQSILEVIFFFNPAMWWISREIRQERENCCDDLIVQIKGQPVQYIKTLAAVNHFHTSGFKLLPGFFGNNNGQLLKRMQRLVGAKARSHSPHGYKVISLLLVLLSFFYFGWINKDLSSLSAEDNISENNTVATRLNLLSAQPYTALPAIETDTIKDDITKEQEAKIKEQEKLIEELKAKIEAMEAREQDGKVERQERIEALKNKSLEWQRKALKQQKKARETQSKKQLQKLEEIEVERIEELREILQDEVIEELSDLKDLDYLNENQIKLEIQEQLQIINEEMIENIKEIQVSGLGEMELNNKWMKEMMQMQELELGKIQIDLEETLDSVNDGLREFTKRMDRFKERLVASLEEDGIITGQAKRIKITKRDDRIIVNGEKLSEKLSQKYRKLLEEEFGGNHWESYDDDFNFQFDLE